MKTMVTLRKLMDEVDSENLDADTTLIEAESIAVLDDDYDIRPEPADLEGQED